MSEAATGGIQKALTQSGQGGLSKYRSVAVGPVGFSTFLLYEMIMLLCVPLPGAAGLMLRRLFYPLLFKKFGGKVRIGRHVVFRRPVQISIGQGVIIEDYAVIDAKADGSVIELGDYARIGRGSILSCNEGALRIGDHTSVGPSCRLGSMKGLEIGDHVLIEEDVCISGAGHGTERLDIPIIQQPVTCDGPSVIGSSVRMRARSTLLNGLTVGEGAEVIHHALVNKNVAEGAQVQGVPAHPVRTGA